VGELDHLLELVSGAIRRRHRRKSHSRTEGDDDRSSNAARYKRKYQRQPGKLPLPVATGGATQSAGHNDHCQRPSKSGLSG
jgi:hypothetical protein